MSEFCLFVDKCTELPFLTILSLFYKLLARTGLKLVRMIELLKSGVSQGTVGFAAESSIRVVILTFFRTVQEFVRLSSEIKGFVSINAEIPVMIFRLVSAKGGLVSKDVKYHWIYCFEVQLKSFLEAFMHIFNTNLVENLTHLI